MYTLDLYSMYFKMATKPGNIAKTAFITMNVCFAFKRIYFALYGSPSTCQKAVNTILRRLLGKGISMYMNDMNVMASTFKEYFRFSRSFFPF